MIGHIVFEEADTCQIPFYIVFHISKHFKFGTIVCY
jgi:hypothetical protein